MKGKFKEKQSGITLVALIVTIIILLILAGITIMYTMGDNGILKAAKEARNRTEAAIKNEQQSLGELANMLKEEYGGDNNQGGNTTNPPEQPDPPVKDQTITDVIDKIQDTNTVVQDKNGNPITVPGGFKVVPNSPEGTDESQKVEYTYNGDGTPAVQDGIVVEDEEGNQFVWIPIGDIKNKDGTTTTIKLGRYTFGSDGTPTLRQNSVNYTQQVVIETYYSEVTSDSRYMVAKDLVDFIAKTKTNSGYYLGRYEASKGTDDKVKLQADKVAWSDITQEDAATTARGMYSSNYIESDLMNSYSWDTAIVFIQNYSRNSNYANEGPINSEEVNTGKAGDRVCNIHDMASNCWEWTTERSSRIQSSSGAYPCIPRGGCYYLDTIKAARRTYTSLRQWYITFRPICYVM